MDVSAVKTKALSNQSSNPANPDATPSLDGETPDFAALLAKGALTDGTDALREKLIQSADTLTAAHSVTRTIERAERPEPSQRSVRQRTEPRRTAGERDEARASTGSTHTERKNNTSRSETESSSSDRSEGKDRATEALVPLVSQTQAMSFVATSEGDESLGVNAGAQVKLNGPQQAGNGLVDGSVRQGPINPVADLQAATTEPTDQKEAKQNQIRPQDLRTANIAQSEGIEAAVGDAVEGGIKVTVRAEARDGQARYQGHDFSQSTKGESWTLASQASDQGTTGQNGNNGDGTGQNGKTTQHLPQGNSLQNGGSALAGTTSTSTPSFRTTLDASSGQNAEAASGSKATSAQATGATTQQQREASRTTSTFRPTQTPKTPDPSPVEQIRLKITKGAINGDTIRIQLRPETLGKVDIRLEVHEGRVSAHVVAETRDALDLLKADARNLERALQDSGLKADSGSLNFSLRGEGNPRQADQNDGGRQGAGTPYDPHRHTLDDDLAEAPDIESLRRTAAAARGGVDVRI
ncbi:MULTISPECIES: flagellar hook-length control protein FliK [unclassified Haematospirillum]|uniref:flagellar hook-length control protein FliK n=1 Tax=unclassified Haematospirillum TaxID=2622088 RepID=UPI001438E2CA|nr:MULTISPECIES: flagellar hook-length control protein FliK [unclassified Haematospirillum]NKD54456.1 hypothetical protein [Haematospirillum sp. H4890]NKD74499.1 hypothetical protein [Haematospirillum sp. H4485]